MLYDVYESMQKAPQLAGVAQTWGEVTDLPTAAAPRITWVPTRDDYEEPMHVAAPFITEGRRVEVEGLFTRWAGCELELYVPAGPQGPREMEQLINKVHVALVNVMLSQANYRLGTGRWLGRKALSDQTLGYVQPLQVAVPIFDLAAAQLVAGVSVQLRS